MLSLEKTSALASCFGPGSPGYGGLGAPRSTSMAYLYVESHIHSHGHFTDTEDGDSDTAPEINGLDGAQAQGTLTTPSPLLIHTVKNQRSILALAVSSSNIYAGTQGGDLLVSHWQNIIPCTCGLTVTMVDLVTGNLRIAPHCCCTQRQHTMPVPITGWQLTLFQRRRCDRERERVTAHSEICQLTLCRSGVPRLSTDFTPSILHMT